MLAVWHCLQALSRLFEGQLGAQPTNHLCQRPAHGMTAETQSLVVRITFLVAVLTAKPRATDSHAAQRRHEWPFDVAFVAHRLLTGLALRRDRPRISDLAPRLQQLPADLQHALSHQLLGSFQLDQSFRKTLGKLLEPLATVLHSISQMLLDEINRSRCTHGDSFQRRQWIDTLRTCSLASFLSQSPIFAPQHFSRTQPVGRPSPRRGR